MTTHNYDPVVGQVLAILPGVTADFAATALLRVVGTFCRTTDVWREDIQLPVVGGRVYLASGSGVVCRVLEVKDAAGAVIPDWVEELGGAIYLPNNASGNAVITVSLRPTHDASDIPSELIDAYHDLLVNGTVGDLAAMHAKPWSNPQAASFRMRAFRAEMASVRSRVARAGNPTYYCWQFPFFG